MVITFRELPENYALTYYIPYRRGSPVHQTIPWLSQNTLNYGYHGPLPLPLGLTTCRLCTKTNWCPIWSARSCNCWAWARQWRQHEEWMNEGILPLQGDGQTATTAPSRKEVRGKSAGGSFCRSIIISNIYHKHPLHPLLNKKTETSFTTSRTTRTLCKGRLTVKRSSCSGPRSPKSYVCCTSQQERCGRWLWNLTYATQIRLDTEELVEEAELDGVMTYDL